MLERLLLFLFYIALLHFSVFNIFIFLYGEAVISSVPLCHVPISSVTLCCALMLMLHDVYVGRHKSDAYAAIRLSSVHYIAS
jgi:hypothetical protein